MAKIIKKGWGILVLYVSARSCQVKIGGLKCLVLKEDIVGSKYVFK